MEPELRPRDVVKLAFQFQETEYVPYYFLVGPEKEDLLTKFYGGESWRGLVVKYIGWLTGVNDLLSSDDESLVSQNDGLKRDHYGCSWQPGSIRRLVDWPLHEPQMGHYCLPDLRSYYNRLLQTRWPEEIRQSENQFRIICHCFGLFERAWSLRSFEDFLVDLAVNEKFAEELLEHITEWLLQSVDLMATAPIDGIMFTDDHAEQRGLLMGENRWRRLFKPRWKRIYERVHHYGLYTIMHMCGNTSVVIPDLIEVGLDCMESCQPECMDIYDLKKCYGGDVRFWGGLGAQSILPFGTPSEVRAETRHLKCEMGCGGGYILAGAKPPSEEVPVANIVAYLEEACAPRL